MAGLAKIWLTTPCGCATTSRISSAVAATGASAQGHGKAAPSAKPKAPTIKASAAPITRRRTATGQAPTIGRQLACVRASATPALSSHRRVWME